MLFEASPPKQLKDEVVVNAPDPKQFPDAYVISFCFLTSSNLFIVEYKMNVQA